MYALVILFMLLMELLIFCIRHPNHPHSKRGTIVIAAEEVKESSDTLKYINRLKFLFVILRRPFTDCNYVENHLIKRISLENQV